MVMSNCKPEFDQAVAGVKTTNAKITQEVQLDLYGAFKQALGGDCNTPAPSRLNVVNYAKWQAWQKLKGVTQGDARKRYVEIVRSVDPSIFVSPPNCVASTDITESNKVAPKNECAATNKVSQNNDSTTSNMVAQSNGSTASNKVAGNGANKVSRQRNGSIKANKIDQDDDDSKPSRDNHVPTKASESGNTSTVADCQSFGFEGEEDSEIQISTQIELQQTFDAAVDHITASTKEVSQDDQLQLYGAFKQAVTGNVSGPPPSRFNIIHHAKWQAWKRVEGLSRSQAQELYIRLVRSLDDTFQSPPVHQQRKSRSSNDAPGNVPQGKSSSSGTGDTQGTLLEPDIATETHKASQALTMESNGIQNIPLDSKSPELQGKEELRDSSRLVFESAVQHVKGATFEVSQEDQLELYGAYKQATLGDVAEPCPSRFSMVQYAKWQAWAKLKGSSKEDAMQVYVSIVRKLDPLFRSNEKSKLANSKMETSSVGSDTSTSLVSDTGNCDRNEDCGKQPQKPAATSNLSSEWLSLLYLSVAVFVAGFVGFIVSVVPPSGLLSLFLVIGGASVAVFVIATEVYSNGILCYLSPDTQKMLLESTFLKWCLDDTFTKLIVQKYQEIIPIFMCDSDEERAHVLSNMAPSTRKYFTTKGLVNTLPESLQVVLIGSQLVQARKRDPVYEPPLLKGPPNKVARQSQAPDDEIALNDQNELRAKLANRSVQRILETSLLSPSVHKYLKMYGAAFSTMMLAQLVSSARARRILVKFVGKLMVLVPAIGSSISLALLVLYKLCVAWGLQSNAATKPKKAESAK